MTLRAIQQDNVHGNAKGKRRRVSAVSNISDTDDQIFVYQYFHTTLLC